MGYAILGITAKKSINTDFDDRRNLSHAIKLVYQLFCVKLREILQIFKIL